MSLTSGRSKTEINVAIDESDLHVGGDVLQLLTSAMYHEPLIIFRELAQNSLDSLDNQANSSAAKGILVNVDRKRRTIEVSDDGPGIAVVDFAARMCSLGGSVKRQSIGQRGFRGVGRLAALGYCRTLEFRSRNLGSAAVLTASWDCTRLREFLRSNPRATLSAAVSSALTITKRFSNESDPPTFFKTTLIDVSRLPDDRLLDPEKISLYLSDNLPSQISTSFPFESHVNDLLSPHGFVVRHAIRFEADGQVRDVIRRLGASIGLRNDRKSAYTEFSSFHVDGYDGGLAAIGWVAHHEYPGNLIGSDTLAGLRVKVGGIQVGDENLIADLFPEARFNAWTVGEVHILDPRIIPNGRRDGFEPNVHWQNVSNNISVIARAVVSRCRALSITRNRAKQVIGHEQLLSEFLECVHRYPFIWTFSDKWFAAAVWVVEKIEINKSIIDIDLDPVVVKFKALKKPKMTMSRRDAGVVEVINAVLDGERDPIKILVFLTKVLGNIEKLRLNDSVLQNT